MRNRLREIFLNRLWLRGFRFWLRLLLFHQTNKFFFTPVGPPPKPRFVFETQTFFLAPFRVLWGLPDSISGLLRRQSKFADQCYIDWATTTNEQKWGLIILYWILKLKKMRKIGSCMFFATWSYILYFTSNLIKKRDT
jgi:hypothetical protein